MWKTLPVWFVIALVLVAVVGSTGVWMLQVESPASYDEPFTIKYSDELNEDWKMIDDFPHEVEKDSIDLTYGTYHDFINISSKRRRPVKIIAAFSGMTGENIHQEHIGFVILEGLVDPDDVIWNENGTVASYENNSKEIEWGHHEKSIVLNDGSPETYTLITVLSNNAPLDLENDELFINWQFSRAEVRPGPTDPDIPPVLRSPYNLTPYIILASAVITMIIGYLLFKDSWEVK